MNKILPIGLSITDNSISSKFNIGIENITIGQSAGLGSTGINNVFLGNRAGFNATNVSETLLIGMNAGTNILTGIRNIIIGEDTSKITNKLDTVSIGYNSIANNSIGVGLDIISIGNSNISYGLNINSYGINSISYGNYIDITNSLFFIDTLGIDNNYIDGIIVKNISGNTDYDTNSILYKRYDIDNNNKLNIIDYNTDIILNFRINTYIAFKFSLGFYTDNTDINVFTIDNNILYYNDIEYNIQEALLYESDNILRIVNKHNDTSSISIYINSEYDTGFAKNIINKHIIDKNINNIRISYDLNDNNVINNYEIINSNIINSNIINSNITNFDNDIFNNKNTGISFNDFIISINNIDENNYNNVAYGKNISIKGTKNICMGNNLNATGYNSILIGDNISYYDNNKFTKNIQNSIIIGNNNFKNNYNKNSIIIGNDNFNNIIDENDIIKYDNFLKKNPIIISSNVNTVNYVVNIADTILKYDDEITEKQVLLSGLNTYNNKTLPVGIGYSNLDDLNIINDNYKLYVKDGIYTDKIYSETYYGNGENLINISFNGKTTSSLIEGDNLYFTKERVEEILTTYNIGNTQNNISINDVRNIINSCNYISNNNNIIINSNLNVLGNITGNGSNITNLNMNNADLGILSISRGGTGVSSFSNNAILTTDSSGIIQSSTTILPVLHGGTGVSSFTENKLLFGNSINSISSNTLLHWDNINNRLGVGTDNPIATLDVYGRINVSTNNINVLPTYTGTWSGIIDIPGTNDCYAILNSDYSSSKLHIPSDMYCDLLMVGGGGNGGNNIGGGGGGGAVLYAQNIKITSNLYTILVSYGNGYNTSGFGAIISGGGKGGTYGSGNEILMNGGSGGGAAYNILGEDIKEGGLINNSSLLFNTGYIDWRNSSYSIYGNKGGSGSILDTNVCSGGGGGAGAKGNKGTNILDDSNGYGHGGKGFACDITGTLLYYGAGGGGGCKNDGSYNMPGNGGLGGGGGGGGGNIGGVGGILGLNNGSNGTQGNNGNGGNGANNTGSGGGGGSINGIGGIGGSGVIIIRWKKKLDIISTLNILEPNIKNTKDYSVNKLTIYDNGNIYNEIPISKLHIFEDYGTLPTGNSGTIVLQHNDIGGTSSIVFKSNANSGNDYGYISYRDNSKISDKNSSGASRLIIGTKNNDDDHIILLPSGNVGIGTQEPTQKLNILGAIRLNDVILNTNESFLTISDNSLLNNKINIGYDKITCNYCIQAIEDSIYKNLMLNKLGGFVSIGNISASANLHVASGSINTSNISQRYFNVNNAIQTGITPPLKDLTDVCAIFESTIWCKSYVTTSSDIRIKKNIKNIDDKESLNLILAIEPKTYDYIDSISNTSSNIYGFIAQQIKDVIPNAVVMQKNIIPNIYSKTNCEGNNIYLSSNIDLSEIILTSNTSIKLIDESGKEYNDKIIYSSNNHIVVEKEINTSNVFVYGTEVEDFHTIDKSYIYTLNVCATQILSRKIDILERENEILKQENEIFKNELMRIKTHLGI